MRKKNFPGPCDKCGHTQSTLTYQEGKDNLLSKCARCGFEKMIEPLVKRNKNTYPPEVMAKKALKANLMSRKTRKGYADD